MDNRRDCQLSLLTRVRVSVYDCFLKMCPGCIQNLLVKPLYCFVIIFLVYTVFSILKDMKDTVKVKEGLAGPLKTAVMIWDGEFEVFRFSMSYFSRLVFFVSPKSTCGLNDLLIVGEGTLNNTKHCQTLYVI